ncbi:hypothetical protein COB21_04860 [Candidatus Aerophobetes bacterium]|uniref:VTT domain-containing protein n=1 Tax=Aerophobetes bacterium TaxID=2030807 RepID=A0A2A4X0R4_UNCAE|nr:MAG: hypothetical protein COB21_04860 [Candidatus Aerophobetes bacterium]
MDALLALFLTYIDFAPLVLFILLLLAGCLLPISIDLLLIVTVYLSFPPYYPHPKLLLATFVIGTILGAWIEYWIGRKLGRKLLKLKIFKKLLPEKRLDKMRLFYKKHGFVAMLVARFLPFGGRSCAFFSSGLSRVPFLQFAIKDAIACIIWFFTLYSLLYSIGTNKEKILELQQFFHIVIISLFSLAGICFFWYKRAGKKKISQDENPSVDQED